MHQLHKTDFTYVLTARFRDPAMTDPARYAGFQTDLDLTFVNPSPPRDTTAAGSCGPACSGLLVPGGWAQALMPVAFLDNFQFTYDEKTRIYTLGEQLNEQLDGLEHTSEYPDISDLLPDFPLGIILPPGPPVTSPTTWPPTVLQTSLQFREYVVGSLSIHITEPRVLRPAGSSTLADKYWSLL
ncbi:hypothetical protein L211DRAFT_847121 [Terfezia boudieri ATCC MYA-4762]|uniref:Uncharacterized protein n=1 Tax=Terfezia boudieri ATCC MYA-4762 TaxID=1051890 RepID=A0A3N4LU99_9PEZI|nr:hypothetical protein L211DRAFT_847121 [Terfezia boudieri ATCC MYA-4762]